MTDYTQQSAGGGYRGEAEERRPYNAQQGEFVYKEGNDYPASGGEYGEGFRSGEKVQEGLERMTGYGDTDSGVGGPKSGYGVSKEGAGAFDRATSEQTQFGLEGKTGSYGHEGSDPQAVGTDTSSFGAVDDPLRSEFDRAPRSNVETAPGGDGWGAEDTSRTHGAKEGLMSKIKETIPGQQTVTGEESDPSAPPKKGILEKIKEKLPGHHGSNAGM